MKPKLAMKVTTENQNITFENTLASLVLKSLDVHFTLSGGHQSKIVDNGINGSQTTVSVGYTVLGRQYW